MEKIDIEEQLHIVTAACAVARDVAPKLIHLADNVERMAVMAHDQYMRAVVWAKRPEVVGHDFTVLTPDDEHLFMPDRREKVSQTIDNFYRVTEAAVKLLRLVSIQQS